MTLTCRKCQKVFTCTNHNTEIAWNQLSTAIIQHAKASHPKMSARVDSEVEQMHMLIEGYMRLSELAVVEEGSIVEATLDEMAMMIASGLGFDVDEEEEEELQESEGSEGSVSNEVVELPNSEKTE